MERRLNEYQYQTLVDVLEQTKQMDGRSLNETDRMIRSAVLSRDTTTTINVTNAVHPDPDTGNLHFDIQIIRNGVPLPTIFHIYVQPELFFEDGADGLIYYDDTTTLLNETLPQWRWVYMGATR